MIEWNIPNLEETTHQKIDRNIFKLNSLGLSNETISKLFDAHGLVVQPFAVDWVLTNAAAKKGGA